MSNLKEGENPSHRKSKVSWAMIIIPGLVGPKPRRRRVGDGQRVNIPVPACTCFWMRIEQAGADYWFSVQPAVMAGSKTVPFRNWIPADTVTRKAQKLMVCTDRTANRHRCSGRVAQGVRVILRQGTRQYSDRNLGIRSALPQCF